MSTEPLPPAADGTPRVSVMESTPAIRPTTNPYIVQLVEALRARPGLEVHLFSFRRAILGRYDVFHVHWPEALLTATSGPRRWRRRVLTLAMLLRLRITRTPLVRTWHNLERPQGLGRVDGFLLDLADRWTTLRIALNPVSTFTDDKPSVVIPHGHYRDWYGRQRAEARVPGRVAYVGLIRRYKGVENLVTAFRALDRPGPTLRVSGRPSTDDLARSLEDLAGDDPRIGFDFSFLDDAAFVRELTSATLVVLPYHHMHNSGVALAALSVDRPTLVPDTAFNRLLAEEVGPGWLYFFSGELTTAALEDALAAVEASPPTGRPNLDRRDWPTAGADHEAAFRRALALAGRVRGGTR